MFDPNVGDSIRLADTEHWLGVEKDITQNGEKTKLGDGKIIRDDAWEGPEYDNPYLKFYCSNDMEHDIDSEEIIVWSDVVEGVFLSCIVPDL